MDIACELPQLFAWVLGLQTNIGPCPQGKTSHQNSQGTRGRSGEGGSSGQALAITFPLQAPRLPMIMGGRMEGPQTSVQLPFPTGCKAESSRAPSTLHTTAGAEHAHGTPVSPQSACEQGVPCFRLRLVPSTLKEVSLPTPCPATSHRGAIIFL